MTSLLPLVLVTKTSSSNQCNRAEQKATPKPLRPPTRFAMAFVGSNVAGIKRARQPNEKQREQEAHHELVTAL